VVSAIIDAALIRPLPIREVLLPPFCGPDNFVENMRMMDRGFNATLHLSVRVWSERVRSLRQRLHVTALRQGIQDISGDDVQAQTAGLIMVLTEIAGGYHPARPDPAFATSVDAPRGARRIFQNERRLGWVLTSVRPLMRPFICRGPVSEFADQVQIKTACSRHSVANWLPDPASPTLAPYSPSDRPYAFDGPRSRASLRRRDRSSVDPALCQQGPDDPGCLVGQRHRHQHSRFACQHLCEP
jgi:hypothetical protein